MRSLTAILLGLLLGSCSSPPSPLEQIMREGRLRVVTQNSPATFYYGVDEPRGIEYELARGFAEHLGVELSIATADRVWEIFPEISAGRAHIGAAALTTGAARETLVAFGPAYQQVEQQLVYRRGGDRPESLGELAGKAVHVLAGSPHAAPLARARPGLVWTEDREATAEALIRRVAQGEIDYAVVDSNAFQLLRHYYPEARVAFGLGRRADVAWALPRNARALRERVAAYFAEIEASGELQAILDRYYYAAREFDYVGSRAFVRHLKTRLPDYRAMFEQAGRETGVDWRLLAAMSYQESHWDAQAVSPTGVRGLMMLTRETAGMLGVDRNDPRESIVGGARYYQRVLRKLPERIPDDDRQWLAVAAYNIGFGHVEDARIITEIQGGDIDSWQHVRERLPLLSNAKWHSRVRRGYARGAVPVQYVENVRRYYALLQWMTDPEILTDESVPSSAAPNRS